MAEWLRQIKHQIRVSRARKEIETRQLAARAHSLGVPLVVTLTSYPARYGTLALTLKGVLRQSLRADHTFLCLTAGDEVTLPPEVLALRAEGLEIITEPEPLKVYTKFVPVMRAHPGVCVVTADDDLPYGADWLAGLVETAQAHPGRVIAHRAHRVCWQGDKLAPYDSWPKNISGAQEGPEIFATGVGGVLYPPGCLHPDALRSELFLRLCPGADDIWLYWMTRLAGSVVRHVGPPMRVIEWPGSQQQSLRAQNHGASAGNERAIAAMTAHYGLPRQNGDD